jgi:hypothetical protein
MLPIVLHETKSDLACSMAMSSHSFFSAVALRWRSAPGVTTSYLVANLARSMPRRRTRYVVLSRGRTMKLTMME